MLNDITIMGRLTRDPELRFTQSGTPVASFTVAVERDYAQNGEKATDFIDCVAWRQSGEFVSRYFCKGDMICVSGRLESRRWQDRDGNNRVSWEINTAHSYFCGSKRDNQGGAGQPPYRQAASGSTLPPHGEARKDAEQTVKPELAPDGYYYCQDCGEIIRSQRRRDGGIMSAAEVAAMALERQKKQLCAECLKKRIAAESAVIE